jgi:FAD binding domain
VSVRGGGHAVAGHAVVDGGLMIDLSPMKAVLVDPGARAARAAGGVLLGELDRATQRFGLAAPSGVVSHTGIGGLTLGGGLGHTMRRFGLTVDNLLGVDLVTADAERLHVDAWTEPELFWGLRGGRGQLRDRHRLRVPAPPAGADPARRAGLLAPGRRPRGAPLAPRLRSPGPDELGVAMFARLAPPGPFVAPEQYGRPVLGLVPVWAGDPAEGLATVAPLRRVGRPVADNLRPLPYLFLQSMVDGGTSTAGTGTGGPSGCPSWPTT